jgi:hypothetical protein
MISLCAPSTGELCGAQDSTLSTADDNGATVTASPAKRASTLPVPTTRILRSSAKATISTTTGSVAPPALRENSSAPCHPPAPTTRDSRNAQEAAPSTADNVVESVSPNTKRKKTNSTTNGATKKVTVPKKYTWNNQNIIDNITTFSTFDSPSVWSTLQSISDESELVRSFQAISVLSQKKIDENDIISAWLGVVENNLKAEREKATKRIREAWCGFCIDVHFRYVSASNSVAYLRTVDLPQNMKRKRRCCQIYTNC